MENLSKDTPNLKFIRELFKKINAIIPLSPPQYEEKLKKGTDAILDMNHDVVRSMIIILYTIKSKGSTYEIDFELSERLLDKRIIDLNDLIKNEKKYEIRKNVDFIDRTAQAMHLLKDKIIAEESLWLSFPKGEKCLDALNVIDQIVAFVKFSKYAVDKAEEFKKNLQIVVDQEKYEEAAILRDSINGIENEMKKMEILL